MTSPSDLLRAVVDPTRLAILGRAAIGPVDVTSVATELGISEREARHALARLRALGLLTREMTLDRARLREVASQLPQAEPAATSIIGAEWSPEEANVLATFFSGDRLTAIPTQRSKRLVVLERLAGEFEPGVRYPEKQVNFMLQLFHRDHAALRRYLVDEGFLTRADGVYWRTGGRFDPAPRSET